MILESRIVGRKKAFEHQTLHLSSTVLTLQDLITEVVRAQVKDFNQNQRDQQLIRILTPEQFQKGLEQGKITSGGQEFLQEVNPEEAIEVAITAFKDGLYYVFLEDQQLEDLSQTVHIADHSKVLFVRLTALAGG